jgi:RND superfamily putative drug exporter
VRRLADSLAHDPEVLFVASGTEPPFVAANGRSARVAVVARDDYGSPRAQALVRRLRTHLVAGARFPTSARVSVGGTPAQGVDFLDAAYGAFPWLVAAVLAVSFGALAVAFRSLLVPLKAVVLNALTVAAAYGGLVVVFQHGSVAAGLGLTRTDEVEGWVPILLFAIVFGLSMDYEVFIVSRIREAWERGADNDEAVRIGLERTGAVVTAAAAIMAVAFAGFLAGSVAGLQQLGFGLALAVLLDVTLVRMLLVPAVMTLAGRWNWWLPGRDGGGGASPRRLRRSRAT